MRVLVQNTLTNRQWIGFDGPSGFTIGSNFGGGARRIVVDASGGGCPGSARPAADPPGDIDLVAEGGDFLLRHRG